MAKSKRTKEEEKPVESIVEQEVVIVEEAPALQKQEEVIEKQNTEIDKTPEPEKMTSAPIISRKEMDATLTFEERISAFLESRSEQGYVKLNDFLKSLYGVPKFNEPPGWLLQNNMKQLGWVLSKMQESGQAMFANDQFKLLGKHYYTGTDQKQAHHNLTIITIEAKK